MNSRSRLPTKSTMVMLAATSCCLAMRKTGRLSSRMAFSTSERLNRSSRERAYALRKTRKRSRSFSLAASTNLIQASSAPNSGMPVQSTARRAVHSDILWPSCLQLRQTIRTLVGQLRAA
ncbi:hypothetical protein K469DRAFT_152424 [Zopfia rhizophila CBS 207.26]|uniref:Uncharacterized protein n=1 Tax=Zopfia rhizophila CBS 207.26 TaxID=1314779 RepID=A0A6A6E2F7_9PEZI|nr:hypothetical protein K469DRAFT_152424 [Zopfia rhizophila CBS 207.26]